MDRNQKWHRQVGEISIGAYVRRPMMPHEDELSILEGYTQTFLGGSRARRQTSPETDRILAGLVEHHEDDKLSAVCACIPHMSYGGARGLVLTVGHSLNLGLYLKFFWLLEKGYRHLMTDGEVKVASMLRSLFCLTVTFELFRDSYSGCEEDVISDNFLIPAAMLSKVLEKTRVASLAQAFISSNAKARKLYDAFQAVSWLSGRRSIIESAYFREAQPSSFPEWDMYTSWRPNGKRIFQWARSEVFTESQRRELGSLFMFEGPDTTKAGYPTLREAKHDVSAGGLPAAPWRPSPTELLDLLDQCIDSGPFAVELFFKRWMERSREPQRWGTVRQAVLGNEPAALINAKEILFSEGESESRRIEALPVVLSHLRENPGSDETVARAAGAAALHLLATSRRRLSALFESNTYSQPTIWTIWKLGREVVSCRPLHAWVEARLMTQLRDLPDKEALEAILQGVAVHESFVHLGGEQKRYPCLKIYLCSRILGQPARLRPADNVAVLDEIRFWRERKPHHDDLVTGLPRLGLDYPVYIEYLVEISEAALEAQRYVLVLLRQAHAISLVGLMRHIAIHREDFTGWIWIELIAKLIEKHGQTLATSLARSYSSKEFLKFIIDTSSILLNLSTRGLSSPIGRGVTQIDIDWWLEIGERGLGSLYKNFDRIRERMKRNMPGSQELVEPHGKSCSLFFGATVDTQLLAVFFGGKPDNEPAWDLLVYLEDDGNNSRAVLECASIFQRASAQSPRARELTHRILGRLTGDASHPLSFWSEGDLVAFLEAAATRPQPGWTAEEHDFVKAAYRLVRDRPGAENLGGVSGRLLSEFASIVDEAFEVEGERRGGEAWIRSRERPEGNLGPQPRLPRRLPAAEDDVPERFLDSVEVLGPQTYLVSFILQMPGARHELRMRGAGLQPNQRFWSVKVRLGNDWQVCIFSGVDDGCDGASCMTAQKFRHGLVNMATCACSPSIFAAILTQRLVTLAGDGNANALFEGVADFASHYHERCIQCYSPLEAKIWCLSTCTNCQVTAGTAVPAAWQSPALDLASALADIDATDLILTSLYNAVADPHISPFFDLPGTLTADSVVTALDRLPRLQQGVQTRRLGRPQKTILQWIRTTSRSYLIKAPPGFEIPGLPRTQQYLVANGPLFKQQQFDRAMGRTNSPVGRLVFHGTRISCLLPILCDGLRVMTGARAINTVNYGNVNGIYLAEEPSTSTAYYAKQIGRTWANSRFQNPEGLGYHVLLACELAGETALPVHIETDEAKVMVRYVILFPPGFACPARATIEDSFTSAFSQLRRHR